MKIVDILRERGQTHGDFTLESRAVRSIVAELEALPSWYDLPETTQHAVYMAILKIVRTANGKDPTGDSLTDAIGYLSLARAVRSEDK